MPDQVQDDLPPLPGRLRQVVDYIVGEASGEDWRSSLGEEDDALDRPLELTGRHLHVLAFAVLRELSESYREVEKRVDEMLNRFDEMKDEVNRSLEKGFKAECLLMWEQIGDLNQRLEALRVMAERKR